MKRRDKWFLFAGLAVLSLAVTWLFAVPARLAISLAHDLEDSDGLGVAVLGPTSIVLENSGLEARFRDLRIASPRAPSGLRIRISEFRVPLKIAHLLGDLSTMSGGHASGATVELDLAEALQVGGSSGKTDATPQPGAAQSGFSLVFRNSSFTLADSHTGFSMRLMDAGGVVTRDLQNRVLVHMSGLLNGVFTTLHLEANDMERLLSEGSPADIVLSSDMGELRFTGRAAWQSGLALDGRVFAASLKARSFLTWLNFPASPIVEGPLEMEGAFSARTPHMTIPSFTWKLGANSGDGKLALATTPGGPVLNAALSAQNILLSALPRLADAAGLWSDSTFPWLPVAKMSGTVQLKAKSLLLERWQLPDASMQLTYDSAGVQMLFGADSGRVDIRTSASRDKEPAFSMHAKIEDAPAGAALPALIRQPWLAGRVKLELDVTAEGSNAAAIVSTLDGRVALSGEGQVIGFSLSDLLAAGGKGWRAGRADATNALKYNLLGELEDGILSLDPSRLTAEGLDLTASGEIDLLRKALDLSLQSADGSGTARKHAVSGYWYEPDFGAVTAGPDDLPANGPSQN